VLASVSGKGPIARYPATVRPAKATPARGTSRASRLLLLMVMPPPSSFVTCPTLGGRRSRVVGRLADLHVSRSADLSASEIGRLADDRRLAEVYLRVVHLRLSRLRPFPLDPVKVDWALAV